MGFNCLFGCLTLHDEAHDMNLHIFSKSQFSRHLLVMGIAIGVGLSSGTAWATLDALSALEVLKRNDCTKCHSVKKSKNGPSYNKVARKHRGDPQAEEKLFKHLTTSPMVKLEDGTKEKHKKTDFKSPEHIREFIRWILSL